MNSQRGKASTNASRQNKSQKSGQVSKSQTNANKNNNAKRYSPYGPSPKRGPPQNLRNQSKGSGRLGLSSSSSSRLQKSHLIDEDEYIADVNGSVAFATTAYPINPGQSRTFPWGNQIAALYEKYEFTYLEFYYTREVSEFATNGQAGKVMLSVDFDASDAAPSTKKQVLDTIPHDDGMPCKERISLVLDCRQLCNQDSKYVRPGAQPANTDIKTYDAGNFFISTYGNTNTTVIGELRVRYKVLVSVPVLESPISLGTIGSYLQVNSLQTGETAAATTVYGIIFAQGAPVIVNNSIGALFNGSTTTGPPVDGSVVLLSGVYLIELESYSTNSAVSVTGGQVAIGQADIVNTDLVLQSGAYGLNAEGGGSNTLQPWFSRLSSMIWNTTLLGKTLYCQNKTTYASGTTTTFANLKITLIQTLP